MLLKKGEHLRCPKCGGKKFGATAHVTQDWELDEYGTFQKIVDDLLEVTHEPDRKDSWDCKECGYSGPGSEFVTGGVPDAQPAVKDIEDRFENLLTERSDIIYNAVYNMLLEILGETKESMPWDMDIIGSVADAIEAILPDFGKHLCRPYRGDENHCFKLDECECAACPMK